MHQNGSRNYYYKPFIFIQYQKEMTEKIVYELNIPKKNHAPQIQTKTIPIVSQLMQRCLKVRVPQIVHSASSSILKFISTIYFSNA